LRQGEPLSAVTARLAQAFGLEPALLPATDDRLRTWLQTPAGELPFQEWFVARGHRDDVDGVRFEGAEAATPAPGVPEALEEADLIAIAPSNPFVSIGPILAVRAIREALEQRRAPAVAVSPLIGGEPVRGPAARMLRRLRGGSGPQQVTDCYKGLLDALVIDEADAEEAAGVRTIVTRTLMDDADGRRRVAEAVLETAGALRGRARSSAAPARSAARSPGGCMRSAKTSTSAPATRSGLGNGPWSSASKAARTRTSSAVPTWSCWPPSRTRRWRPRPPSPARSARPRCS